MTQRDKAFGMMELESERAKNKVVAEPRLRGSVPP